MIKIGDKQIGLDKTFIVAEVGSNHGQNFKKAMELIDAAKECGADAVKFQSLKIDEMYYRPPAIIKKLHKLIDMDETWHQKLKSYADRKGIIFFSSPGYLEAVDIMEKIGVGLYKLASAQIGNFPQIIEKVAKTGKPVFLSTGLVSYGDLEKVISIFQRARNDKIVILHCNSIYPTPYEKVNLKLIQVYREMFGYQTGFSDHTLDIYIAIAAVSLGAKVIEKHFVLDKKRSNMPDASISLNPYYFKRMVNGIRAVEDSLKSKPRVMIEEEEERFKKAIIYRLILKNDKNAGDEFYSQDFEFKRFTEGIDCKDLVDILSNFKAKVDLKQGTLLTWKMLEGK